MGQVWILGFAAWKALEAYCPHLILGKEIIPSEMINAPHQAEADRAFEYALEKAEELRTIAGIEAFAWPAHIPELSAAPPEVVTDRAIIDLYRSRARMRCCMRSVT
jgi:hypothetical protein